MKVSEIAIEKLKSNRKCINRLAYEMDVHSGSVDRWIEANENDGRLTTPTALSIISDETGISKSKLLAKA